MLQDEHDNPLTSMTADAPADSARLLDALREVVRATVEEHFVRDRQVTVRRIRLYFEIPVLRSVASTSIARLIDRFAQILKDNGKVDYTDDLIAPSAVILGLLATAWGWYREGAERFFTVYADAVVNVLAEKLTTI